MDCDRANFKVLTDSILKGSPGPALAFLISEESVVLEVRVLEEKNTLLMMELGLFNNQDRTCLSPPLPNFLVPHGYLRDLLLPELP